MGNELQPHNRQVKILWLWGLSVRVLTPGLELHIRVTTREKARQNVLNKLGRESDMTKNLNKRKEQERCQHSTAKKYKQKPIPR